MDEQKYYVGLRSLIDEDAITDFLWEDYRFYPCFEKSSYAITKSELAKIQNGSLYISDTTAHLMGEKTDFLSDIEWVNPMIKLIPIMEVL